MRTGPRWCWCHYWQHVSPYLLGIFSVEEPKTRTTEPPETAFRGWSFRKQHHVWSGPGLQRVSSLLFVGVSLAILFLKIWTNCANCRMLTAVSTEPGAPGTGVAHVCGSCVGKAWYTVDYKTRAGWSALENSLPKIFTCGGCKRAQGEVQWIGFKWEKKKKELKEKCHKILWAFQSEVFLFELFKGGFSLLLFQRYILL